MGTRVLIDPIKKETETKSGIVIVSDKEAQYQQGKVIQVGDDIGAYEVNKGDTVFFDLREAQDIKDGDKSYYLVHLGNILAKIQ